MTDDERRARIELARRESEARQALLDRCSPGWREHIRQLVDAAPPMTEAQRTTIALLLRDR